MDIDIDLPSHKADIVFQCLNKFYNNIGGSLVKVGTFKTETAKSAIQTACRGLGINNDIGMYLSSLIPVERGNVRSIKLCYYGDEDNEIKPITEFKNIIDEHENLLEVALGVEGLVSGRGVHASGQIPMCYKEYEHNAVMKAPNGDIITQFNLHDSEYMGGIKYDFLKTKACSMIQVCLELLIKYKEIEWQGSLRKTYDKYIHPDVLDKDSSDMWDMIHNLIGAFQFDSAIN